MKAAVSFQSSKSPNRDVLSPLAE